MGPVWPVAPVGPVGPVEPSEPGTEPPLPAYSSSKILFALALLPPTKPNGLNGVPPVSN